MNPDEIDIMKLTPEDYLKMRDCCKELERDNILKQDHILELENTLLRMSEAAKESKEKIKNLHTCLAKVSKSAQDYYDEREIYRKVKDEYECRYNSLVQVFDNCAKDADAKIQSANDRAANAKKEAKAAKERAESASERVRYLERKLRDVESLNDSLMKELANRQGCHVFSADLENAADAYQKSVMRYASPAVAKGGPLSLIYGVVGMCGEAGEASELVKKNAFHGHTLDCKHLASELGDVLWYIAYTADDLGYSLSAIMAMNQEKLAKRYPDGKFDAERSKHREEGDI